MYSFISFQATIVNLPDKFGLSHLDPELIFVHLQWWMPGRAWGRPGSEGCGGWDDDQCLCLPGLQLVQTAALVVLCPHLSPPCLGSGALLGWQGFRSSLVLSSALCPSPAAAQLDTIGFSIIKKCIHAVETRGRAALGLGLQLLAVEQLLCCPFHGQNDS